jgi:hypothetical protein
VKLGGSGRHMAAIILENPEQLKTFAMLIKVHELLYGPSIVFPKLAILVLYYRIFTTRPYQITIGVLLSVYEQGID